eukprot:scaffold375160_cov43-Prasinocladus_malaysianus.AAC.1
MACGPTEPRKQVELIVHKLAKRAHNDHDGVMHGNIISSLVSSPSRASTQVTLKCLMTFHRLMRETDMSFMEE